MLRRVAFSLALGSMLYGLAGCGSLFDLEEREPWRAQVEAQCLASGEVHETAGIRIAKAIEGPGPCGVDHPFRVSALDTGSGGGSAPVYANLQPRAPRVAQPQYQPQPQYQAQPDYAPAPVAQPDGLLPPAPVGDTTGSIGDGGAAAPLPYQPEPMQSAGPVQLRDGGPFSVSLDRSLVMSCSMVPTLTRWLTQDVQPAALANFGSPIVEMTTFGSYSCRRRDNRMVGKLSEHAFANAVDVKGFKLADGRETRVLTGWRGSAQEQAFWRDVAYGGCRKFNTVLGPGTSDGMHENHLHLDLARHSATRDVHICRPRVPAGWLATAQRRGMAQPEPEFTGSIQDPTGDQDE
ncbi:extensin family protein [Labrys okinawensis]|uniref:extensin-like domain-containing protein n=1 Tax=Labrys okinawensis TaxID=346911 RepID=UPI0039BCE0A7